MVSPEKSGSRSILKYFLCCSIMHMNNSLQRSFDRAAVSFELTSSAMNLSIGT